MSTLNVVLDVSASLWLLLVAFSGFQLFFADPPKRLSGSITVALTVLCLAAVLSNCASTPPLAPTTADKSDNERCKDMLAVACLHAEGCGMIRGTARECLEALSEQCSQVANITQEEADRCSIATADAPCGVVPAKECEGIADEPPRPPAITRGVSL